MVVGTRPEVAWRESEGPWWLVVTTERDKETFGGGRVMDTFDALIGVTQVRMYVKTHHIVHLYIQWDVIQQLK